MGRRHSIRRRAAAPRYAAATPTTAAATLPGGSAGEAAEIADELFEEGEFAAWCWRGAGGGVDRPPVIHGATGDVVNEAVLVEIDRDHLLVKKLGLEEGDVAGALADIIPGIIVEGGDARGRPQEARHRRLIGLPRLDLIERRRVRLIAALIDGLHTAREHRHQGAGEKERAGIRHRAKSFKASTLPPLRRSCQSD